MYNICHNTGFHEITLDTNNREPIYVITENYPESYGSNCRPRNNTVTLSVTVGYGIQYEVIDVHLYTGGTCTGVDRLVWTWLDHNNTVHSETLCNNKPIAPKQVSTGQINLTFVGIQQGGHANAGFLLSFTGVCSHFLTQPEKYLVGDYILFVQYF